MPPLGFSQKQAFLNNRFKQSRKIQLIGRSFLRKQADGRHAGQGVGFKAINTVFVNHKVGPCICAETENTEDFAGCFRHALGGRGQGPLESADLVVANILGPLLIRFADEIVPCVKRHLVVSGILNELYPEVLAAYEARSFREVSSKTIGEWTTGLLEVVV